jgi:C-terminal processing protease CtpA/Prc
MLGNDGLCHFFVAFDYANERIHLRRNASFDEPFETDMSGMLWEPTPEGSVEVVDVIPNSPAAESGLEAGDLILAVDGRQVRELGATALERLLLREGLQLRLTVERGMDRSERNLVTRRLI